VTNLTVPQIEPVYLLPMTLFQNKFRIETTRLPDWDYRAGAWYFVTICTKNKECSLGSAADGRIALTRTGTIAQSELLSLANHYQNVIVDHFVIMPNHIHAIIVIAGKHAYSPNEIASPISPLTVETGLAPSQISPSVETRLAVSSGQEAKLRHPSLSEIVGGYKSGVCRICHKSGIANFAWQTRFYDHILCSNSSVNAVRDYIEHNPDNWLEDPDRDVIEPAGTIRR
jgi:putative transposase